MTQYRTDVWVPDFATLYPWDEAGARDNFYDIVEAVGWHTVVGGRQGLEGTRRRPTDGKVWIHLEADDLYELCGKVRDLETELNASFGTETIMLDRPTLTPRRYRV